MPLELVKVTEEQLDAQCQKEIDHFIRFWTTTVVAVIVCATMEYCAYLFIKDLF